MKVFCIIPALNEEKTISKAIEEARPLVDQVVVVDDGSIDATRKKAEESGAIVLAHLINRGQGASLETGNKYAIAHGAEVIVHFDADGQFLAEEIKEIIAPIERGEVEVVLGSRFLNKKSDMPWFKEKIIYPIARIVNRLTLDLPLSDPQCGFRALSREALKKISIKQDRMAHCSEILYKISKNKLKVKEVPITVIYYDFGQKFSGGLRIIKDLLLAKLMD